jgi:hypothetical protein
VKIEATSAGKHVRTPEASLMSRSFTIALHFRGGTKSHNPKRCLPVSLQERSPSLLGKLITARSRPNFRQFWIAHDTLRMLPTHLKQARENTAAMILLQLQLPTQRSLLCLSLTQIRAYLWQVSVPAQLHCLQCAVQLCFWHTQIQIHDELMSERHQYSHNQTPC